MNWWKNLNWLLNIFSIDLSFWNFVLLLYSYCMKEKLFLAFSFLHSTQSQLSTHLFNLEKFYEFFFGYFFRLNKKELVDRVKSTLNFSHQCFKFPQERNFRFFETNFKFPISFIVEANQALRKMLNKPKVLLLEINLIQFHSLTLFFCSMWVKWRFSSLLTAFNYTVSISAEWMTKRR